jgi:hypothetical protein
MRTVATQLRANAVALFSLAVALSSFSYTAWRTERSEANRTTRQAAFQLLVAIGQLQEVLYRAHYDHDADRGSPRSGWVYVQTINDFSAALAMSVPSCGRALLETWRDHWEGLGMRDEDAITIDDALGACRGAVVGKLRTLR